MCSFLFTLYNHLLLMPNILFAVYNYLFMQIINYMYFLFSNFSHNKIYVMINFLFVVYYLFLDLC